MEHNAFIILGSSSGMPQAERASAGYALRIDEKISIIDCGGGVCSSFLRSGLDPLAVENIFISHTHPDHCCELPLMIQLVYLAGKQDKLDVYVPSEFVKPLETYLTAVYLIKEKLPFELNIIGYDENFTFSNSFHLRPIKNRHLQGYTDLIRTLNLPNRMQCFSFQITADKTSLFYSADIAGFDEVKDIIDNHDYVVIESTHINLDDFFAVAPTKNVGSFVISHLGTPDEIEVIRQYARKAGMDNLKIAEDGMVLPL